MVRRAWLFGVILAVPLIGFAVAEGIQAYFNSQLRSALRKQFPDVDVAAISSATVDRICESPDKELGNLCDTNRNLNLMSGAALGAGAAGIALLLIIRMAGAASRGSRTLLLYVFKPGLYLTASVLIMLVLVHAAVAVGAIYYGESVLVNRVHIGLIGAIGLGAVAGVMIIAQSAFGLVKKARTFVIGNNLSRADAPKLWETVDDLGGRLKSLRPQNIVVGLDPNFFVYYGLLGNRYREEKLARCRQLLGMPPAQTTAEEPPLDYRDRYEQLTGCSLRECPVCHRGRMRVVETLPAAHGPPAITDTS